MGGFDDRSMNSYIDRNHAKPKALRNSSSNDFGPENIHA